MRVSTLHVDLVSRATLIIRRHYGVNVVDKSGIISYSQSPLVREHYLRLKCVPWHPVTISPKPSKACWRVIIERVVPHGNSAIVTIKNVTLSFMHAQM